MNLIKKIMHFWNWNNTSISTKAPLVWEISCSVSKVAWAVAPMPVWKSERLWSVFLLAWFSEKLSYGKEAWNANVAGWLEKLWINLNADILPACSRGKCSTPNLAPQFMWSDVRIKLLHRNIRIGIGIWWLVDHHKWLNQLLCNLHLWVQMWLSSLTPEIHSLIGDTERKLNLYLE